MITKTQHFTEKYPLFNGGKYLEVTDSVTKAAMSGLTEGIFKISFKGVNNGDAFSLGSSLNGVNSSAVFIEIGIDYSIHFFYRNSNTLADLNAYVNVIPTDFLLDGENHIVKIYVDGDFKIDIDGVVYSNTDITYKIGTAAVSKFTIPNIEYMAIGGRNIWSNGAILQDRWFNGNINSLSLESLDELTTYYSFQSDYDTFSASATTVHKENTLLDLQYNNSNVDTSDDPKTVTAIGTENYGEGLYGEINGARGFLDQQYDTAAIINETESLSQYTISGWIKNNINPTALLSTINVLSARNGSIASSNYNNNGCVRFFKGSTGDWYLTVVYGDYNSGDVLPAKGRFYEIGKITNQYVYVAVAVDTVNKTLAVYLNCKDISDTYDISGLFVNWDADLNSIETIPLNRDIEIGFVSNSSSTRYLPNCEIYNAKVRKYLIGQKELKAEYKKYLL